MKKVFLKNSSYIDTRRNYTYRLGWKINGQWKYKRISTDDDLMVAITDVIAQAESISINKVKERFKLS